MNFEQAIVQVQDTLIVMAEIQRRQGEIQKMQAEEIAAQADLARRLSEGMEQHERCMQHIELNLSEISGKLNGLIGFMDNFYRRP